MKKYTIRTEQPRDFKTVENLTREAFWNVYRPGCTEHYVLHCYRSEPDFVPELKNNFTYLICSQSRLFRFPVFPLPLEYSVQ